MPEKSAENENDTVSFFLSLSCFQGCVPRRVNGWIADVTASGVSRWNSLGGHKSVRCVDRSAGDILGPSSAFHSFASVVNHGRSSTVAAFPLASKSVSINILKQNKCTVGYWHLVSGKQSPRQQRAGNGLRELAG